MFDEIGFIAAVGALAAAGAVAWGATQGVSPGEIIHGVEHMRLAKDQRGNLSIRTDDPGDEVGFVKAMHEEAIYGNQTAADCCSWATRPAGGFATAPVRTTSSTGWIRGRSRLACRLP